MGLLLLFAWAGLAIVLLGTVGLAVRMHRPHRRTLSYALAKGWPTEPADVGLTGVETSFTFADGTASPGWVIDGTLPGGGPLIVVVHGWTSSRFSALRRAARLAPFAGRVVVFDLRAHGDSTAKVCLFGKRECGDIAQVIEQVDQMTGEKLPVVLAGSSMGAGMALMFAAGGRFRERIVGVIAEGVYRWPMEPVANHLRSLGWPAQPFCWLVGVYLMLLLRVTSGGFDRANLAEKLACPLLVLHGSDDPISPIASARAIAQAAKRGTLVEFPGGGHGGLALLDEGRYTGALADFFTGLRAGGESDKIKCLGLSGPDHPKGAPRLEHADPA